MVAGRLVLVLVLVLAVTTYNTGDIRDMDYFKYDIKDENAEYYEILQSLMENWEYEIVEFKEPFSFL